MPDDLRKLIDELAGVDTQTRANLSAGQTAQLIVRLRQLARKRLPPGSLLRAGMDSEDLAQDTLIDLIRAAREFRGTTWGQFFAFVNALISQRAASAARRAGVRERELRSTSPSTLTDHLADSPSVVVSGREEQARMQELVADLPEIYRVPLTLRLEGKDTQTIAEAIGQSHAATRQRLSRALRLLKERW